MYRKRSLTYVKREDLYFSLLKGNGIYSFNLQKAYDPTDLSGEKEYPLFTNILTEEQFLTEKVFYTGKLKAYYQAVRDTGRMNGRVFWPADIIALEESNAETIIGSEENRVEIGYAEKRFGRQDRQKEPEESYAFLFPGTDIGISKSAADELREINEHGRLNWKDIRVRRLIVQILCAYRDLNACGYLNMDADFRHFYLTKNGNLLFKYSHLIMDIKTCGREDMELREGDYPMEFALPALVNGRVQNADMQMQNYSIAAMLFYLMIGRLPYAGPLMTGYDLDLIGPNEDEHINNFKLYHKNAVFIFDPEDERNHLGDFSIDRKTIDLWEELPERIKNMFCGVFQMQNPRQSAIRDPNYINPGAKAWLRVLDHAGWSEVSEK